MFRRKKLNYWFKPLSHDGLCFALCLSVFVAKIHEINKNGSKHFQQTKKKNPTAAAEIMKTTTAVVTTATTTTTTKTTTDNGDVDENSSF